MIESPEFEAQRNALESVPGAVEYLPAIQAALERGLAIPTPFHDHVLKGAAAAFRSVIVGEIDDGDPTFILIYRIKGQVLRFLLIDQHDSAYARLKSVT